MYSVFSRVFLVRFSLCLEIAPEKHGKSTTNMFLHVCISWLLSSDCLHSYHSWCFWQYFPCIHDRHPCHVYICRHSHQYCCHYHSFRRLVKTVAPEISGFRNQACCKSYSRFMFQRFTRFVLAFPAVVPICIIMSNSIFVLCILKILLFTTFGNVLGISMITMVCVVVPIHFQIFCAFVFRLFTTALIPAFAYVFFVIAIVAGLLLSLLWLKSLWLRPPTLWASTSLSC